MPARNVGSGGRRGGKRIKLEHQIKGIWREKSVKNGVNPAIEPKPKERGGDGTHYRRTH